MSLLSVKNLSITFNLKNEVCAAVNNVSYNLQQGETLGIVGESGAGKSVSSYSLIGLLPKPPAEIVNGEIIFNYNSNNGSESNYVNLLELNEKQLRKIRGKNISIIFQDPMTSLNPYMPIGKQIAEPLKYHFKVSANQAKIKVIKMLEDVGIPDPKNRINQYPHEFSGGMRQRIMIAMALITNPQLLIADEPTTALDVTIQAQILDLLKKLQQEHGMAIIFITHDLSVVAQMCDRVCVLYAGQIMEISSVDNIFYNSKHPYTVMLKQSLPTIEGTNKRLFTIPGLPPDLTKKILGCPFAPRCYKAKNQCSEVKNLTLSKVGDDHYSSCILQ